MLSNAIPAYVPYSERRTGAVAHNFERRPRICISVFPDVAKKWLVMGQNDHLFDTSKSFAEQRLGVYKKQQKEVAWLKKGSFDTMDLRGAYLDKALVTLCEREIGTEES